MPNAEPAVALAPESAVVHAELGHTLVILQRKEEVEHAFSKIHTDGEGPSTKGSNRFIDGGDRVVATNDHVRRGRPQRCVS